MKKGLLAVGLVGALVASAVACGGGGGGGGGGVTAAGSCNAPADDMCLEVLAPASPLTLAAAEADCDSADGETWSLQGCSVPGSLGTCTLNAADVVDDSGVDGGTLTGQVRVLAYPTFAGGALGAQAMCQSMQGTWVGAAGPVTPDGGVAGPTVSASCNIAADGICSDVTGAAGVINGLQSLCEGDLGVWSTSACPTTNLWGTCTVQATVPSVGTFTVKDRYYQGAVWSTQQEAEDDCGGGDWTPN